MQGGRARGGRDGVAGADILSEPLLELGHEGPDGGHEPGLDGLQHVAPLELADVGDGQRHEALLVGTGGVRLAAHAVAGARRGAGVRGA